MGREDHLTYTRNLTALHEALAAGEQVTLKKIVRLCDTSRSGAMRYVNALRKLKAPIEWDKKSRSYKYTRVWDFSRAIREWKEPK